MNPLLRGAPACSATSSEHDSGTELQLESQSEPIGSSGIKRNINLKFSTGFQVLERVTVGVRPSQVLRPSAGPGSIFSLRGHWHGPPGRSESVAQRVFNLLDGIFNLLSKHRDGDTPTLRLK